MLSILLFKLVLFVAVALVLCALVVLWRVIRRVFLVSLLLRIVVLIFVAGIKKIG